jgi:peptide/nickel transport system permease protein
MRWARPPAVERYFEWIGGFIQGDLGTSFASRTGSRRTVAEMLAPRLFNTMILAGITALLAVPLALCLGVLTALFRNGWFDRIVNSIALTTISIPEFFIAYTLVFIIVARDTFIGTELARALPEWVTQAINWFLNALPRFSILADVSNTTSFREHVWLSTLPAITLTLVIVAHMMRRRARS